MTRIEALERARSARNDAKAALDTHIALLRADIDQRGLGGRVKEEATEKAADAIEQAVEIAEANKAIVAGTVAALALWFLRTPLMRLASGLIDRLEAYQEEDEDD